MKNRRPQSCPEFPKELTGKSTITEAEVIDNAKNGAIVCIKAVKSLHRAKGFNLFVNLTWKDGDLLLITQQKEPRNWVDLNRMFDHIEKKYREVPSLIIFMQQATEQTEDHLMV